MSKKAAQQDTATLIHFKAHGDAAGFELRRTHIDVFGWFFHGTYSDLFLHIRVYDTDPITHTHICVYTYTYLYLYLHTHIHIYPI